MTKSSRKTVSANLCHIRTGLDKEASEGSPLVTVPQCLKPVENLALVAGI